MAEMDRKEIIDLHHRLRTQWQARNGEYDLSRSRYNGDHWDSVTNPIPANRYSLTLNYLRPVVDKAVFSLVGRIPAIQVMPTGTDLESRRHAESLEGILYGTWNQNSMQKVLFSTAWDSFVLRRGLVYIWWDPKQKMVRVKNASPDHFFPEYDGDTIWRAVYVSRRNTERLKAEYPDMADQIKQDSEMDWAPTISDDMYRSKADGQTTVFDVFNIDGTQHRLMGEAVRMRTLHYPFKDIPFIEFPCFPQGGMAEPLNLIDQLVELNQYLDQLVSQKADIIARYANPTILDFASGQSAEDIRRAVAAQGAVIPVRRDGNIGLLNWQGTVPAIDEQIALVMGTIFDLSGTPRSVFGDVGRNNSGVSVNASMTPLSESTEAHESVWGDARSQLNEYILMLWEEFMKGEEIVFRGRYPTQSGSMKVYDVALKGKDINGWYKNRIKWPSAIRIDDPVYVQNHLQQLQAQPFPAISLYTYLEQMGFEDVEAEIDRIGIQLEDPRFHPDRMKAAIDGMTALQGQALPGAGVDPNADPGLNAMSGMMGGMGANPPGVPGADQALTDSMASAGAPDQNLFNAAKKG